MKAKPHHLQSQLLASEDDNMQEDLQASQQEVAHVSSSELPEEWEEIVDPDSGRVYYYNAADGTTSWDRPVVPVPAESHRPVPDSEPERTSETELSSAATENAPMSSGSWNMVSSQGSYDAAVDQLGASSNPEVHIESAVSVEEASAESPEQVGPGAPGTESLPPNWTELTDPSSGNKYYLNELTNETTWERPAIIKTTPEEEDSPATDDAEVSPTNEQPVLENPANAEDSEDAGTGSWNNIYGGQCQRIFRRRPTKEIYKKERDFSASRNRSPTVLSSTRVDRTR